MKLDEHIVEFTEGLSANVSSVGFTDAEARMNRHISYFASKVDEVLVSREAPLSLEDVQKIYAAVIDIRKYYDPYQTRLTEEAWSNFCWREDFTRKFGAIHDFFSQEYIDNLARYIEERLSVSGLGRTPRVLEVGAGNGALSHYLRQSFARQGNSIEVFAADNGAYRIPTVFHVQPMDYIEALREYKPDIVLASWLDPVQHGLDVRYDCMYHAQQTPSVQEFIHVGPLKTCGMHGVTWNPEILLCESKEIYQLLHDSNYCFEGVPHWYKGKTKKFSVHDVNLGDQIGAHQLRASSFPSKYNRGFASRTFVARRISF